ncbi:MAG: hypothetical protein IKL07_10805 [Clostridium sp.]|nr:hypothetical protein [Clostridium sp.]
MKSFSFICEILVTVTLLFLVPVFYFQYQEELLLEGEVEYQTIYFTDSVRNVGFVSRNMYEQFLECLSRTRHVYDVEITVYEKNINTSSSYGYWLGTYTDRVMEEIYGPEERFSMHQGNFVSVVVNRKDRNMLERVMGKLGILGQGDINIPFRYGGMIRDECF